MKFLNFCLLGLCSFVLLLNTSLPVFAADATSSEPPKPQLHFLSLADIHFDPFMSCNKTPCPLIQKLRAAPATEWGKILSSYDVQLPKYRQETNYPLLVSSMSAAQKIATEQNVQFVLILGDFLGHDYRTLYEKFSKDHSNVGFQSFVKKTLLFLNSELARAFPKTDVYALVGNNDTYHYDYYSQPHGAFFHDVGAIWSTLIKNKANRLAMQKSFPTGGYYAFDAPGQPQLRVIILNSNLFSSSAKGEHLEEAATAQLDWLKNELDQVSAKHQKAIIAMHIPTGVDVYMTLRVRLFTLIELWKKPYTKRFHALLKDHAPNIAGIFAGHLHSDWFQIMTFDQYEIPVTGIPAISPIFGNNPGFKLYSFSPELLQIEDFVTYYYSLTDQKSWNQAYEFSRVYLPNCRNCPIVHGMKNLKESNHLAKHYKYFYRGGTGNQHLMAKWSPYYWCSINNVNAKDYRKCIG